MPFGSGFQNKAGLLCMQPLRFGAICVTSRGGLAKHVSTSTDMSKLSISKFLYVLRFSFLFYDLTTLCLWSVSVTLVKGQEKILFWLKILVLVATNTAGNCLEVSLRTSSHVNFTGVEMWSQTVVPCLAAFSPTTLPPSSLSPGHTYVIRTWYIVLYKC